MTCTHFFIKKFDLNNVTYVFHNGIQVAQLSRETVNICFDFYLIKFEINPFLNMIDLGLNIIGFVALSDPGSMHF